MFMKPPSVALPAIARDRSKKMANDATRRAERPGSGKTPFSRVFSARVGHAILAVATGDA
jgi:hypothetical protein